MHAIEVSLECSRLPTVSAVMPVYNGRAYLEKSLPPLLSMLGRDLIEVIVVDDSSDDGSRELAERLGARVIPSGGRLGPAASRNRGARAARGDVLLLVDADVGVHPDAVEKVLAALASADVAAVFGSYDDRPADPGFWSQYKNLLHHHTHQSAGEEASTFWTGLSAIRRDVFLESGGFDSRLYSVPSIEDVELGYRLRASGRKIRVLHTLQGTHFKRWTLGELLRTDIFRRALPWSRLILESPHSKADLNVRPGEMARAGAAMGFAGSLFLAAGGLVPGWIPAVPLFLGISSNSSLASLFYRRNGPLFALGGLLFHQVYYLYSSAAFAWCYVGHQLRPFRRVKHSPL
jgi:glycosyltransferase involved in cell wall biosynthesis